MIRGTTAQFKFKLPYTKGELESVVIKFWQPHNENPLLPITKTLDHCGNPPESKEVCVALTPSETALFLDKYKAKVQIRVKHAESGSVFGSKPKFITVYPMNEDILKEDSMGDASSVGIE